MKKIFICAGELSGDKLGAGLIKAAKALDPNIEFYGVAGPAMIAAGCKNLYPIETLSVMGVLEIIPKLPKILKMRKQIIEQLIKDPPDMYIGIDSPDFNLPIEAKLKQHNIKTVHYVCPSVWAWREGRVKKIRKAADLVLCVLPFEKDFLAKHHIKAEFVGHRSADILPNLITQKEAREQLAIEQSAKVITILPGSRRGEIARMMQPFLQTAQWCYQKNNDLQFIIAAANQTIADQINQIINQHSYSFSCKIIINQTYAAIKAADAVLATSGTVTLETFLLDKPMVVAYKTSLFNWLLVNLLVKVKYAALPNLLADKEIIPEFLQNAATPENMGPALMKWLNDEAAGSALKKEYNLILNQLKCNADNQAAKSVLACLTT
ncbi:MAG: lipid-A-disaccharide synthase [Gammaproteobacteria bacterium]|jgi:lipid-A-disaccharide synthase